MHKKRDEGNVMRSYGAYKARTLIVSIADWVGAGTEERRVFACGKKLELGPFSSSLVESIMTPLETV